MFTLPSFHMERFTVGNEIEILNWSKKLTIRQQSNGYVNQLTSYVDQYQKLTTRMNQYDEIMKACRVYTFILKFKIAIRNRQYIARYVRSIFRLVLLENTSIGQKNIVTPI